MMSPPKVVRSAFSVFFEYDTPRIVHIRSKKVGVINRFLQLVIIGYVIGYAIVWKKGYQEFDNVKGAVTTKLKGVVYTNDSYPGLMERIWDVGDYVVPPQENGAFFVMTNVLVTPDQIQDVCEEDPGITDGLCNSSDPNSCVPGQPVVAGNGVKTGVCVNSSRNSSVEVCMIRAWCPVEDKTKGPKIPALAGSENFTVFIKNNIEFPKFGVQRRNLPDHVNDTYLENCRYNPRDPNDKYCPIFRVGTMVSLAGHKFVNLSEKGGVIQIVITWDCNLDYSEEDCLPEYSFRRLDRGDYAISAGYNFRFADHYKENNVSMRTLYKATGIRFMVTVQGQAGKFNVVPLLTNLGAGLAILSVATIVCDIIVLYLLKARSFYKGKKYLDVRGDDAYEVLDESQGKNGDGVRQRQPASSYGSVSGNGED